MPGTRRARPAPGSDPDQRARPGPVSPARVRAARPQPDDEADRARAARRMVKVLVSACLLGERVRYNGADARCPSDVLERWAREGRLVPFCPEVAGGLPVPRPAAEIGG